MPIKGDVKKQFLAMREMVKDSVTLSTIQNTEGGSKAVLKFTGNPEQALSHPNGRRPFEPFKKVVNIWNSFLKKELDKKAKEFK